MLTYIFVYSMIVLKHNGKIICMTTRFKILREYDEA